MITQKNSRRLSRSPRRKSRSATKFGATFPGPLFLPGNFSRADPCSVAKLPISDLILPWMLGCFFCFPPVFPRKRPKKSTEKSPCKIHPRNSPRMSAEAFSWKFPKALAGITCRTPGEPGKIFFRGPNPHETNQRKTKGGGKLRGGENIPQNAFPKTVLDPPTYDTFSPPVCFRPVVFLTGNRHRPGKSHFLSPPKLVLEGALYGTFSPPKIARYVLPPQ